MYWLDLNIRSRPVCQIYINLLSDGAFCLRTKTEKLFHVKALLGTSPTEIADKTWHMMPASSTPIYLLLLIPWFWLMVDWLISYQYIIYFIIYVSSYTDIAHIRTHFGLPRWCARLQLRPCSGWTSFNQGPKQTLFGSKGSDKYNTDQYSKSVRKVRTAPRTPRHCWARAPRYPIARKLWQPAQCIILAKRFLDKSKMA